MTGTYFLKNFRFLNVTWPEPSIRMTYWSNWRTSTTIPDLSHLVALGPLWFCNLTQSPTLRGGRCWVCSSNRSHIFSCLLRSASSLASRVCLHAGWGKYLPGWMGIKSLMAREWQVTPKDLPWPLSRVSLLNQKETLSCWEIPHKERFGKNS